jgi:integrase/recombinase XerD
MISTEKQTKDFRDYLTQMGYSKSSCAMLPGCIRGFLEYHDLTAIQSIRAVHIRQFYEWLHVRPHRRKEGGLSSAYIGHHVYALKLFFNWLEDTGQLSSNPISAIRFPRAAQPVRQPLSQQETKQLFAAAQSLQELALLHLFYSCGLRRGEAEKLNTRDIHFNKQLLYVRSGKGAKRRAVPMTEKVSRELENYYHQERATITNARDTEAFMLGKTGQRMRGEGYNRILKSMLERTGISRETTLHHLRHSIATHLLASGLEIEKVRDFLGHRHLESTQLYAKVAAHQLRKL